MDDNSIDLTSDQDRVIKSGVLLGIKLAADFLSDFDAASNHRYKLGDCLLAKFNLISKDEMRLNRDCGIDSVLKIVARELKTTPAAILSRGRTQAVSRARHLCCYLCGKVFQIGVRETAAALGLDHTSVLYGARQGRRLHLNMGKAWKQLVDKIITELGE